MLTDPDVPLLPPFPAGESKLASFRAGLEQEGPAGAHARRLLDAYAEQEASTGEGPLPPTARRLAAGPCREPTGRAWRSARWVIRIGG